MDLPNTALVALSALVAVIAAIAAHGLGRRLGASEGRAATAAVERELEVARERIAAAERERRQAEERRERAEIARTQLAARLEANEAREGERAAWLAETTRAMNDRFEAVAARIVDERAARVDGKLRDDLAALLTPLGERLREFRARVDATHESSNATQAALREQLHHVVALNQTLAEEARRLTNALRGSSQRQGAWGEIVLDRVLEASGLRKGEEFVTQDTHARDDGSRVRPDAVVRLPGGRHVVVDAKVSLVSWESFVAAESDGERTAALSALASSLRAHVRGLVPRAYAELHGERGVDFVVLFVPIEAAFAAILAADPNLAQEAWRGDVLLASPSTLLFVLRTVAHQWRTERQELNAKAIADRGAELYDKLTGFVADLEQAGAALERAQSAHAHALTKLHTGKGNVIRQAELLRELGVKPKKQLPAALVDVARADVEYPSDDGDPASA
jgi:DNA recombination protein RmuC